MKYIFTKDIELEILNRYQNNKESSNSIAESFNVSPTVIINILKKYNTDIRTRKTSQKTLLSDEEQLLLKKMYLGGYTAKYLSEYFNITLNRTKKYLAKLGAKKS